MSSYKGSEFLQICKALSRVRRFFGLCSAYSRQGGEHLTVIARDEAISTYTNQLERSCLERQKLVGFDAHFVRITLCAGSTLFLPLNCPACPAGRRWAVTLFTGGLFFSGVHDCFAIWLDRKVTKTERSEIMSAIKKQLKHEYLKSAAMLLCRTWPLRCMLR